MSLQVKPTQTKADRAKAHRAKSDHAKSDHFSSDANPDHANPDRARARGPKPDRTNPEQAIAEPASSDRAAPLQVTRAGLAEALLARTPPILLEALPREYYDTGHIPTAGALPLDEIDRLIPRMVADNDAPIVVYCANAACKNSHQAAERLAALGYGNIAVYPGGKQDWVDAGLRLEK